MDYIAEKDIRKDDTVIVYKAGDIIPAVLRVVMDKRVSEERLEIPSHCPSCESELLILKMKWPCVVSTPVVLLKSRKA